MSKHGIDDDICKWLVDNEVDGKTIIEVPENEIVNDLGITNLMKWCQLKGVIKSLK